MSVSYQAAKRRFNIHAMLRRIRLEVKQFADAAMFDLAERGYSILFHQLVACIISVRTRDEVSLPRKNWVEINRLLVAFGKHVCTGRLPKCSTYPVLEYCRQVSVAEHS